MAAKLINLESIDGGGKGVQTKLIQNYCKTLNLKFKHIHFPMYEHNTFSELIAMFLRGEFGPNDEVDPYFVANIFAMDRFKFLPVLQQYMEEYDIIVLDRYVFSNMAYQGAKLNGEDSDKIKNWIYQFEFNFLKLPYPDINIFLDVPSEISKKRMELRDQTEVREYTKGKADIHEADLEFQEKVRNTYLNLVGFPNYHIIPCVFDVNDKQYALTPTEIFKTYEPIIEELLTNNL